MLKVAGGSILLLDDEPRMCRRFEQVLLSRGYDVIYPDPLESAIEAVQSGQVVLMIHNYFSCPKNAELCEMLTERFPFLPTIHLTAKAGYEDHKIPKGPQHQYQRHLTSEKSMMRRVEYLTFVERVSQESLKFKRALSALEDFEKQFDSIDQEQYLQKTLGFLGKKFRAENVLWMVSGGIEYHTQNASAPSNREEGTPAVKKPEVVAWKEIESADVGEFAKALVPRLPMGWASNEGPQLFSGDVDKADPVGMVPVMDMNRKKALGHFIVINPKSWGKYLQSFDGLVPAISRKMTALRSYYEAKELAYVDDVTELFNQRYLFTVLEKEIKRCRRTKNVFSVLFIDIDHFKRVNDSNGHLVGSKLLVALGKVLKRNIRATDFGFRYGGDEYLLLAVGANSKQAEELGERIRREVQDAVFDVDGVKVKLTISVGVASYPEHARTKEDIVRIADEAMYYGKNKSRKIVYVAS